MNRSFFDSNDRGTYGVRTGYVLRIGWVGIGYVLGTHWVPIVYVMGTGWVRSGHVHCTYWLSAGYDWACTQQSEACVFGESNPGHKHGGLYDAPTLHAF